MSELLSLALVCAGTLPARDCSRETALDVIVAHAPTPMACFMHVQTMAARAGFPGGDGRNVKVACEHRRTESGPVAVARRAS